MFLNKYSKKEKHDFYLMPQKPKIETTRKT